MPPRKVHLVAHLSFCPESPAGSQGEAGAAARAARSLPLPPGEPSAPAISIKLLCARTGD